MWETPAKMLTLLTLKMKRLNTFLLEKCLKQVPKNYRNSITGHVTVKELTNGPLSLYVSLKCFRSSVVSTKINYMTIDEYLQVCMLLSVTLK